MTLYAAPWVPRTRAAAYYGPIVADIRLLYGPRRAERWEQAIRHTLEVLRAQAAVLGANAVVGVEMTVDAFPEGWELHLRAVGTPATLEPTR